MELRGRALSGSAAADKPWPISNSIASASSSGRRPWRSTIQPRGRQGRVRLAARPVRLRQDHDAADDRGLRRADRGAIALDGQDLDRVPPAKRGARHRIPELRAVPAHDGGRECRVRARDARRAAGRARTSASRDALALVGLDGFGDALSAPALRRPAAARRDRARAGDPAGACCCSTSRCRTSMPSCARRCRSSCARSSARVGTTTILVTHDQDEAMTLSDRIVVMSQGRDRADRHAAGDLRAAGFAPSCRSFSARPTTSPRRSTDRGPGAAGRRLLERACAGRRQSARDDQHPPRADRLRRRRARAKIVTRIFQGNHWLFQCDSECGPVIVIRQNDGRPQPAEGEAVRLAGGRKT